MLLRKILIALLILITFIIPFTQLSIGFYYINSIELCPLQQDVMLLMAVGGVFEAIFFAAAFGFVFSSIPARHKAGKELTAAQISAKGNNRGSQLIIGGIMCIFGACAIAFFYLLHIRVYGNFKIAQWKDPTQSNYCFFTIYASAFACVVATYLAILLLCIVAVILLFGIGL